MEIHSPTLTVAIQAEALLRFHVCIAIYNYYSDRNRIDELKIVRGNVRMDIPWTR